DSSASGLRNGLVTSHSSGPSQITVENSPATQVFGVVGRATPRCSATAPAAGPAGSRRRSVMATNGSGTICTSSGSSANRSDQPGNAPVRASSTVTAGSFRVDQHGIGDLDGDQRVPDRDVQRLPDALAARLDQRE